MCCTAFSCGVTCWCKALIINQHMQQDSNAFSQTVMTNVQQATRLVLGLYAGSFPELLEEHPQEDLLVLITTLPQQRTKRSMPGWMHMNWISRVMSGVCFCAGNCFRAGHRIVFSIGLMRYHPWETTLCVTLSRCRYHCHHALW